MYTNIIFYCVIECKKSNWYSVKRDKFEELYYILSYIYIRVYVYTYIYIKRSKTRIIIICYIVSNHHRHSLHKNTESQRKFFVSLRSYPTNTTIKYRTRHTR